MASDDKFDNQEDWINSRAACITGETFSRPPVVFEDTTNYLYIDRGHFVRLEGELYLVRSNEREGRFGLDEQPKFWVKRVVSLHAGARYILKLTCREAFKIQVGGFQVTCMRDGNKESEVLKLVHGDRRFMQGRSVRDSRGNLVRIIDFIDGRDLLNYIYSLNVCHEEYFHVHFSSILARTVTAIRGIQFLNERGLCHGDIRNDHLMVERNTGQFKWIDFDLTQDFSDFDLWSLGNILHFIVGKGFINFRDTLRGNPRLIGRLAEEDASVFFPHRIMNLAKVFPYIPKKLNSVLARFSVGASAPYDSISRLVEDLSECIQGME